MRFSVLLLAFTITSAFVVTQPSRRIPCISLIRTPQDPPLLFGQKQLPPDWFPLIGRNTDSTGEYTKALSKQSDVTARAEKLRDDARRAREEAKQMDARLTMEKISRVEAEIKRMKERQNDPKRDDLITELQGQLARLQGRLYNKTVPVPVLEKKRSSVHEPQQYQTKLDDTDEERQPQVNLSVWTVPFCPKAFETTLSFVEMSSPFARRTLAEQCEFALGNDNNVTALALRYDQMNRLDYSYSHRPVPIFSDEAVAQRKQKIDSQEIAYWRTWLSARNMSDEMVKDQTSFARLLLEYEYYSAFPGGPLKRDIQKGSLDTPLDDHRSGGSLGNVGISFRTVFNATRLFNMSSVDHLITSSYPRCMFEGEGDVSEQQMRLFVDRILPHVPFQATSRPRKVRGGYVISGSCTANHGNELIDSIDTAIAGLPSLEGQLTVLYRDDPFHIFDEKCADALLDFKFSFDDGFDMSQDLLLYITHTDLYREQNLIDLAVVTATAFPALWYWGSDLNPAIGERGDTMVLLLIVSYFGMSAVHELGHWAAALVHRVNISAPTVVPFFQNGVTNLVTRLKSLPKDRNAMLDVSLAGPLLGMLASVAAIAVGAHLTLGSDVSALPRVPVLLLEQSTLGIAIVDHFMHGALTLPGGAEMEELAKLQVPLHPLAIAGFASLMANALSLLPIGSKYSWKLVDLEMDTYLNMPTSYMPLQLQMGVALH